MLEKAHIQAVNNQLKKLGKLHSQSMTFGSLSMNGTPDRYYDGAKADLWIEFKRLTSMPRSGIVRGDFSELQLEWMRRRAKTGNNVWGVVGLPNRTVVIQTMPFQWTMGTPIATAVSHQTLALEIWDYCHGSSYPRQSESS
jgi:hypothetical protein